MSPALLLSLIFFVAAALLLVVGLCIAAAEGDRELERMNREERAKVGWKPNGIKVVGRRDK